MNNNVIRLEELFVELGPEELMQNAEARMLIDTDPECVAILSALDEVDSLVSQLAEPDAPPMLLAPGATAAEWHVAVDDEQAGPFDTDELRRRICEGTLDGDCLAWKAAMRDWQPISEIEELARLLPKEANHKPVAERADPRAHAAFTPIEWKPTAAAKLSALVEEEIELDDQSKEPARLEPRAEHGPDLGPVTPSFVVPASTWTLAQASTPRKIRPVHLILGGVASSVVTAAIVLLMVRPGETVAPIAEVAQSTPGGSSVPLIADPEPVPPKTVNAPAAAPMAQPEPRRATRKVRRKGGGAAAGGTSSALHELLDDPSPKPAAATRVDKQALAKDDIMGGVRSGMGAVMGCIKTARAKGELAPGRHTLVLEWTIQPSGEVSNPELKGPSNVLGTSLPGCFARGMRKWKFPSTEKGGPVRNFPFGPFTIE